MRRLLLLCLLFPILANAQDKPEKRTCRVLFLNPPANAPKKLYLFDGTTSKEIALPGMNFSDVYEVAGGDTTIRLLAAPVVKVEEIPAGAPSGKVAAGLVDFYLVASADPANTVVPVRFQIIDASSAKFRNGQTMWYNLSPHAVGGQLGDQKLAMKPQSRAVTEAPVSGAAAYDVSLSYLIDGDPKFHPMFQTKWVHDPRARMVMFVYGGDKNTAPEISSFKDFREPPAKRE